MFEHPVVSGGELHIDLDLDKQTNLIQLDFQFKGFLRVECDRCAVTAPYPIEGDARLILQMQEGESDDDEIVYLPYEAYEYNVAQYIYETLALSLPLRVVPCEVTGDKSICDQTVISHLDAMSVPEPKEEEETPVDPRWAALKKLSGNSDN